MNVVEVNVETDVVVVYDEVKVEVKVEVEGTLVVTVVSNVEVVLGSLIVDTVEVCVVATLVV